MLATLRLLRFPPLAAWLAALCLGAAASVALAQEAPDALVKRVSDEVLQIVKTDPKVQAGDRARIREVIDAKLAPHFDFERMTALAVGRGWRKATHEQQKQLIEQFRTLLGRTYSNAFVQYRDQTINYKPFKLEPGATEAAVRTEIARPGQAPVQIDYSLTKKDNEWKAYDVVVGGVSLVTNYRDEFNAQIQAGGIDGLIKSLAAKNAGPAPPPPAVK
jgi:phospholipid transport system substrate-binding protein